MEKEIFRLPKRKLLPDDISERIRDLILSGYLAPGTRLTETEISDNMGVSRGRVREAFHILEEKGLVQASRYKGRWVAELDSVRASEIYEIRMLLEGHAFQLASQHLTPRTIRRLQDTVDEMSEALRDGDLVRACRKDMEFHEVIWESSANSYLYEILCGIRDRVLMMLVYDLTDPGSIEEAIQDHQKIIDELEVGDWNKAKLSLKASIQFCRTSVLKRMRVREMALRDDSEE